MWRTPILKEGRPLCTAHRTAIGADHPCIHLDECARRHESLGSLVTVRTKLIDPDESWEWRKAAEGERDGAVET